MFDSSLKAPVVLAFAAPDSAAEALKSFQQLDAAKVLRLKNAAVISRDAHGKLSIHEIGDLSPEVKWALVGAAAVAGFVAGTLWRGARVGVIAAYAVGQTGAILTTMIDPGFSNVYLEHLAEDVQADRSLLIASVEFKSESLAGVIQDRLAGARVVRPAAYGSPKQPSALSI
jgi:uncharacterized membrane protein